MSRNWIRLSVLLVGLLISVGVIWYMNRSTLRETEREVKSETQVSAQTEQSIEKPAPASANDELEGLNSLELEELNSLIEMLEAMEGASASQKTETEESQANLAETERNEKQKLPPTSDAPLLSLEEKRQIVLDDMKDRIAMGDEILQKLEPYRVKMVEILSVPLNQERLSEVVQVRKEALNIQNNELAPIVAVFEDEEVILQLEDLFGGIPVEITEFLNHVEATIEALEDAYGTNPESF